MPSYVAFTDGGHLVGNAAKDHAKFDPKNTVYGIKRVLGQRLCQEDMDRHVRISPNDVSLESPGRMVINVVDKKLPQRVLPVRVFGMLLAEALANAEAFLDEPVQGAVITVPAQFDRLQRLDVYDAAQLARLNVIYIGSSIESIAVYYGFLTKHSIARSSSSEENVCVILDHGAGSFNAGLVSIKDGTIKLLSVASDTCLGGEDLIDRVHDHFAAEIQSKWSWDINKDMVARHRLRLACEAAIRGLSSGPSFPIILPSLREHHDYDCYGYLSRELLDQLCQDLFLAALKTMDRVLHERQLHHAARRNGSSADEGLDKPALKNGLTGPAMAAKFSQEPSSRRTTRDNSSVSDNGDNIYVNEIVKVGGCSRVPELRAMWCHYFGTGPGLFLKGVDAEVGEVSGCAIHAAILSAQFPSTLHPTSPLSVLPISPFDIGLKTEEEVMSIVVPANTTLPTIKRKSYCLSDLALVAHEPPILYFHQGDRRRVKNSLLICTLDLSELQLETKWEDNRSKKNIQIKLEIDFRQRVSVSAVSEDRSTSRTASQMVNLHRNEVEMNKLSVDGVPHEYDDFSGNMSVSQRRALDLRLTALEQFELVAFQLETKRMTRLLDSLRLWRNWLGELGPGDPIDYGACDSTLNGMERDFKNEILRAKEISGLRSYAENLRTKLLTTPQTPTIACMIQSVDSVTQWIDENEEADIGAYREKLLPLMGLSVELVALTAAPKETPRGRGWSTSNIGTDQNPGTDTQAQSNEPRGFKGLFPESGWDNEFRYSDTNFGDIASYLRNTGNERWSKVPRIYTVLRLIGQLELVDTFLQHDMTDIWFPFSDNTQPKTLKQPHRARFLNTQEAVFSKALELERGARLDDQNGASSIRDQMKLGEWRTWYPEVVDKVISTLSYKEYARKRFRRSAINKKDVKSFLNEVKILKTLSNRHCIDLVGSYSDPRYFALIMHPVAEYNLESYYSLALGDPDRRSILQSFFGCLASTMDYLHSQKVVHQDMKPQNILVKDNSHVLVTDFGIARSWEGLTRATTTADLDRTWVYAAPEVARGGPKNESADVWSLGCVFLAIFTVLKGQSPADMRAFFKDRSDSTSFHDNAVPGHIAAWVGSLQERSPPELNRVLEWVDSMLQVEPRHRCRPFELVEKTVAASESTSLLFCGACCRDRCESASGSNDEYTDRWSEGDDENM